MSDSPEAADAIGSILAALATRGVEVYDTTPPPLDQRASEYVVWNTWNPRPHRGRRLGANSSGRLVRITTRYCGSQPGLVRSLASQTSAVLLDVHPTIPDRHTTPIQWSSGSPVLPEEGTTPIRYHASDVWEFTYDPTGA